MGDGDGVFFRQDGVVAAVEVTNNGGVALRADLFPSFGDVNLAAVESQAEVFGQREGESFGVIGGEVLTEPQVEKVGDVGEERGVVFGELHPVHHTILGGDEPDSSTEEG